MGKTPREKITGMAEGANFQTALEDAINKAGAPSQGYDVQYYEVIAHRIQHGGFTQQMHTYVTINVYDGIVES